MKIEEIDITEIKPYKNNPREIPVEAVEKVMQSIKQFGNNQPIVVNKDNVIVVGHTRWRALKNLGKAFAPDGNGFLSIAWYNSLEDCPSLDSIILIKPSWSPSSNFAVLRTCAASRSFAELAKSRSLCLSDFPFSANPFLTWSCLL